MGSIKGKIETLSRVGVKPLLSGVKNKLFANEEVERKATERAEICLKCPLMVDEPVKELRVTDENNEKVSNKMCDDCWCSIPLKIRQDIEICKKWKQ